VDVLIDGLWGDEPPSAAKATLQSHVARLRACMPRPEVISARTVRLPSGLAAADVDASAFAIATEAGRRLLAAGHAGQAAASIKAGLDLWRGPAYAEFAECRWLEAEATRLDLMRLDALQWRISAELLQADAMPPVAELEGLVREHPTREPLWALLMRALYRSGRQADALEAYQRARRILVSELGVEPGRELRETERLVFAQDPSLEPRAVSAAPEPAGQAVAGKDSSPTPTTRERRTVTVLVAERPADAGQDPEDIADWNRSFHAVLQEQAAYGGTVRAELGGTHVLVFGAPVAHDDDAVRALRAAAALIERCGRQSPARAAASTGEVLLSAGDATASLSGSPLSDAARLCELAAAGEILLSDTTRRLVDDFVEVVPARAGSSAGPWRLRALRILPRERRAPPAALVGRSRELALLHAIYEKAAESSPQLALCALPHTQGAHRHGTCRQLIRVLRRRGRGRAGPAGGRSRRPRPRNRTPARPATAKPVCPPGAETQT